MAIKNVDIKKFRRFEDESFQLGKRLTAIAGSNGTQKSTLLGIIGQPFSIPSSGHPLSKQKTIDGYDFRSQFSEKFKFSKNEKPGTHNWILWLNHKVDGNDYYAAKSYSREDGTIRFGNAEGKNRGDGYIKIPVFFLSLSRLFPLAEAGQTTSLNINLDKDENEYVLFHYANILQIMDQPSNSSVGIETQSAKQKFAGVTHEGYDIFTNSAGESNITRILLAMLSFRRLKNIKGYSGGILLIDELDATMYPFAQERLVEYLLDASKKFNVQVVFTTHSPIILQKLYKLRLDENEKFNGIIPKGYAYDNAIVHLELRGDHVKVRNVVTARDLRRCVSDMHVEPVPSTPIRAYCEDEVAISLAKYLLQKYKIDAREEVEFVQMNLGWANYVQLLSKNAFQIRDSLILLDADVPGFKEYHSHKNVLEESENVMFLPLLVEKGLFELLHHENTFWQFAELYISDDSFTYRVCFRDWPHSSNKYDRYEFKKWFRYVEETLGNGIREKMFEFWFEYEEEKIKEFIQQFRTKYNALAKRLALDILPIPCGLDSPEREASVIPVEISTDDGSVEAEKDLIKLEINRGMVHVKGYQSEDGFVLLKGGTVNLELSLSIRERIINLRKLHSENISDTGELLSTIKLRSPNEAAGFALGYPVNAQIAWKTQDGKTLREIKLQTQ